MSRDIERTVLRLRGLAAFADLLAYDLAQMPKHCVGAEEDGRLQYIKQRAAELSDKC